MTSSILAPCGASTYLAAALLVAAGIAQDPMLDLTGCEVVDISARSDGQVLVVTWTCPDAQSWAVRYGATGVRRALLAKPAPTPSPSPTP